jgi:hypothetical protein
MRVLVASAAKEECTCASTVIVVCLGVPFGMQPRMHACSLAVVPRKPYRHTPHSKSSASHVSLTTRSSPASQPAGKPASKRT